MAEWIEFLMPHRMKNAVTQRWAGSSSLSCRKERIAVLLLCAMAAARVFLFSAAFPFFNNVDERRHSDLVMKYASGHLHRGEELISACSALCQLSSFPRSWQSRWRLRSPNLSPTVSPSPAFTIGFTCDASDRHFPR
jgi:hypothetical protein